jgi:hypothetical protein
MGIEIIQVNSPEELFGLLKEHKTTRILAVHAPEDVDWAPEAWEFRLVRVEDGHPVVVFTVDPEEMGEVLLECFDDGQWAIAHGGPAHEDEEMFDLFVINRSS